MNDHDNDGIKTTRQTCEAISKAGEDVWAQQTHARVERTRPSVMTMFDPYCLFYQKKFRMTNNLKKIFIKLRQVQIHRHQDD